MSLSVPHSWQTFLIYHATPSWNLSQHILSQHITLGNHYQGNQHFHISWKAVAILTLGMYMNFLSSNTDIQLEIYSKEYYSISYNQRHMRRKNISTIRNAFFSAHLFLNCMRYTNYLLQYYFILYHCIFIFLWKLIYQIQ